MYPVPKSIRKKQLP